MSYSTRGAFFFVSPRPSDDDETGRWPGVHGVPPIVVEGDRLWCRFQKDRYVHGWGYRFTAEATFPQKEALVDHWILRLAQHTLVTASRVGCRLCRGFQNANDDAQKSEEGKAEGLERRVMFL